MNQSTTPEPAQHNAGTQLEELIESMRAERAEHMAQVERLDETAKRFNIVLDPDAKQRGGPRKKFDQTAAESVLGLIRGSKEKTPVSKSTINKHWKDEGRAAQPDNILASLVKEGLLKKVTVEGERAASYALTQKGIKG
jgi:hypothetical protein